MTDTGPLPPPSAEALEREKWDAERAFREREVAVREREQAAREAEVALAKADRAAGRWRSPLIVAILAAAVAGLGNAAVAYTTGASQTRLEAQKAEQARILEMIHTGSPDSAAQNLQFLLQAGLIADRGIRRDLTRFLAARTPGSGPVLPSSAGSSAGIDVVSRFETAVLRPYADLVGIQTIGFGHSLTPAELRSGKVVLGGHPVDFRSGITQAQATQLLARDLEPYRAQVRQAVGRKLTDNQLSALTSFVYNVGVGALGSTQLGALLRAGRYDQVPAELMKWDRAGGAVVPGLAARRRAEAALWSK